MKTEAEQLQEMDFVKWLVYMGYKDKDVATSVLLKIKAEALAQFVVNKIGVN